jgi:hypothetical protein
MIDALNTLRFFFYFLEKQRKFEEYKELMKEMKCYTEDNKIYHLNISAKGDKLVYWWSDESV